MLSRILLYPFGLLYGLLMEIRHRMYDHGWLRAVRFPVPVVSVGNINLGGTGKTPLIEYLVQRMQGKGEILVVSRGYGRKTKGIYELSLNSKATDVGDEPLQIKLKFPDSHVWVSESRVEGVNAALRKYPGIKLVLLDDAFQHRSIKTDVSILLCDHSQPFYKDLPIPAGRLREFKSGQKRASAIVVSKCPENAVNEHKAYLNMKVPVFSSEIEYEKVEADKVYGFSGIAKHQLFKQQLEKTYNLTGFKAYSDHHGYSNSDLEYLMKEAKDSTLLCTEKDWVKLKEFDLADKVKAVRIKAVMHKEEHFNKWFNMAIGHES